MKRMMGLLTVIVLLAGLLVLPAQAAAPFERLAPPQPDAYIHTKGSHYDKIEYICLKDDALLRYTNMTMSELSDVGYSEVLLYLQFDFSTDSTVGFAYTEDWDTDPSLGKLVLCDTPDRLARVTALDLSNENDYDYVPGILTVDSALSSAAGREQRKLNLGAQMLYLRARYVVKYTVSGVGVTEYQFSAWTDPQKLVAEGDTLLVDITGLETPTIENAQLKTTYNNEYYIGFYNILSDLNQDAVVYAAAKYGTDLSMECQIRVDSGSWQPAVYSDPYAVAKAIEHTVMVDESVNPEEAYIAIRQRYLLDDGENVLFASAWSEEIGFGEYIAPLNDDTSPNRQETPVESNCGLCGKCNAPAGICIFIWIGFGVIALAGFVLLMIKTLRMRRMDMAGEAPAPAPVAQAPQTPPEQTLSEQSPPDQTPTGQTPPDPDAGE